MPKIKQYMAVLIWFSYPPLLDGTGNLYFKCWKAGGSDSVNGPYVNAPFMYLVSCVFSVHETLPV
jgi:hypothetical protein